MSASSRPKTDLLIGASRDLGYAMAGEYLKRGFGRLGQTVQGVAVPGRESSAWDTPWLSSN